MTVFVQDTSLALCLWILGSIVFAIALLLLSVFDEKREEILENIIFPEGSISVAVADAFTDPQERLKKLQGKIKNKFTKLELSQEKLEETKKTISQLEVTSGEVQNRYRELLSQLKSEVAKTESECLQLHNQIERITSKRDKLKQELDEVANSNSNSMLEENGFLRRYHINDIEGSRLSQIRNTSHSKYSTLNKEDLCMTRISSKSRDYLSQHFDSNY